MRVDLPAPFSPSSATISPRPTFIVTSFSARVPPKDLLTRWKNSPSGRAGAGRSAGEGGMRLVARVIVSVSPRDEPVPDGWERGGVTGNFASRLDPS